jgi:hypothetical protein
MRRATTIFVAMLVMTGTGWAQERAVGAGRVEIGAFPGASIFFGKDTGEQGPNFGNYALGTSVTVNSTSGLAPKLRSAAASAFARISPSTGRR